MLTKICTKCNIEKNLSEFYKGKGYHLGINSICKICTYKRKTKWRVENKERSRESDRKWYKKNAERIKEKKRKWRMENPEKVRKIIQKYYKKNIKTFQERKNKRYKTDPKFKLNHNMSTTIRRSLKDGKNGKHWEDIVGYTIDKLKKRLEKQFKDGMSWENYGEWHIDHKIPMSVFNFTKPEHRDFKKCWALKNLQPLWATENMSKNNSLSKHFQPSLLIK